MLEVCLSFLFNISNYWNEFNQEKLNIIKMKENVKTINPRFEP